MNLGRHNSTHDMNSFHAPPSNNPSIQLEICVCLYVCRYECEMITFLSTNTLLPSFQQLHMRLCKLCTTKKHDSDIPQRDKVPPSMSTSNSFEHHWPLSWAEAPTPSESALGQGLSLGVILISLPSVCSDPKEQGPLGPCSQLFTRSFIGLSTLMLYDSSNSMAP